MFFILRRKYEAQVYSLSGNSLLLTKNTTYKPQEKEKIDPNVILMLLRNTMIKCFHLFLKLK